MKCQIICCDTCQVYAMWGTLSPACWINDPKWSRADIRIIANSFTRDIATRYVYCSPCNSVITNTIEMIIRVTVRANTMNFAKMIEISFLFFSLPSFCPRIFAILPKHIVSLPGIETGSKRVRLRRNTVETATMTYRACQDSEQRIGGGGSVVVSMAESGENWLKWHEKEEESKADASSIGFTNQASVAELVRWHNLRHKIVRDRIIPERKSPEGSPYWERSKRTGE